MVFIGDREEFHKVLELVRNTRFGWTSKECRLAGNEFEIAGIKLPGLLPTVDVPGAKTLSTLIVKFVADFLDMKIEEQQIRRMREMYSGVFSNKAVFAVVDTDGEKQLIIVKAFTFPFSHLVAEISGADVIHGLNLKQGVSTQIHAIARCSLNKKTFLLVAESVSQGVELGQFLNRGILWIKIWSGLLGDVGGRAACLQKNK